jgi:hypothetical protein
MDAVTDFVVCQPFGGRGGFLYLDDSGGLTPHIASARRFDSFSSARENWRLAGPSATIKEVKRQRAASGRFEHS